MNSIYKLNKNEMKILDKILFIIHERKFLTKYFYKFNLYKLFPLKYEVQFAQYQIPLSIGFFVYGEFRLRSWVFTSYESAEELFNSLLDQWSPEKKGKQDDQIALWTINKDLGCEKALLHKYSKKDYNLELKTKS